MPWERKTVEKQREEFVKQAQGNINLSKLCREFGISRKTGYKWISRYESAEGLNNQSRRPHQIANMTDEVTVERILSARTENPGWGARTIHCVLERKGVEGLPCVRTVNNILKRNGCISKEESQKRVPYTRYEKERCNQMWQTDFKGEFPTNDGRYCFPLDILDDHSRFSVGIYLYPSTENAVLPAFEKAFYEYGVPESVLSDNGWTFRGLHQGYTHFEKWLMNHDVLPIHGRIKHPQTQGKIERFHRSMKEELLKYNEFENIEEAEKAIQKWRDKYNNERPHEALGMKCPADIYTPSSRIYVPKVMPYEYSGDHHIVKVNSWGYVRFAHHQIYLSETMIGENIEFRFNPDGSSFFACYRNFRIAEFGSENGKRLNRKVSRL